MNQITVITSIDAPLSKPVVYVSTAPGEIARMTTRAAMINEAAIKAMRAILPRLAGNFPRMIQYWLSK